MINKQQIRPAFSQYSTSKINPFYSNITIENEWEDFSEHSDPVLWKLLTDKNANESNNSDQTDSDDDFRTGSDKFKERELRESSSPFLTVIYNVGGPKISPSEIVNIVSGEGQIPVFFTSEPNWEVLAFPKDYSTEGNHFNEERENPITSSKYVHVRLKCCDDSFAANPQYIFDALDWIKRNAVASSVHFAERKQFQSEINVGQGQLVNHDSVGRMMSDDQIFSSFKNRRIPQYFRKMLLDVLAKTKQFGVYTFFLTCSAAEFHWTEIIQVVARQYGKTLTDEEINAMD